MTTPTTPTARRVMEAWHVVEFTTTGYGLQHPLRCRPDLLGCPLNAHLASAPGPEAPPGRYLMSDAFGYTPLPTDYEDPLSEAAIKRIEAEAARQEREHYRFGWCCDFDFDNGTYRTSDCISRTRNADSVERDALVRGAQQERERLRSKALSAQLWFDTMEGATLEKYLADLLADPEARQQARAGT